MVRDGPPSRRVPYAKLAVKIGIVLALLAALYLAGSWMVERIESQLSPLYRGYGDIVLFVVTGIYILLMTVPFVPGIELGLALLMILPMKGIAVVYFSTLSALCLSFLIGQCIPTRAIGGLLDWLHLQRARDLIERLEPLAPREKLNLLVQMAPARAIPFLLRHRYIAVAVAFNIPGNYLIGGGGGIGMMAGLSGLFRFPAYALMVGVAISPIPLLMLGKALLFPASGG